MKTTPPVYPNSPVRPFIAFTPCILWPLLLMPLLVWVVAAISVPVLVYFLLKLVGFDTLTGLSIWYAVLNFVLWIGCAADSARENYTDFTFELRQRENRLFLLIGIFILAYVLADEYFKILKRFRMYLWNRCYYGHA